MSQAARRQADGTIIVVLTNLTAAPDNSEPATVISEMISRAIPVG
jgi:D-alanyl-D-alanine carboxypeptidase